MDAIARTYGLRPLGLADKPLFDAAFATLKRPVSEYSFANTFIWRTGEKLYWAPIEGHLCVFADGDDDLTMLYPPMGEGNLARALIRCFEIMDDYNGPRAGRRRSRIEYVSDELLARMADLGFQAAPMGGDYVYDTARLIDLAGSELKSKRHARNKFLRDYDVRVEPLGPEHVPLSLGLLRTWHRAADGSSAASENPGDGAALENRIAPELIAHRRRLEAMATREALKHFSSLNMTGLVVWADDRLVGFTLGEGLTPRQASVVIEKADRRFAGAAQYIFSEFCARSWRGYPECNAGDDWDIPSLAWTKASWRPVERLQKWVVGRASQPLASPVGRVGHRSRPEEGGVAIRPAHIGDGPNIAALEQHVFAAEDAFSLRQIRRLLRSAHTVCFVAEEGDQLVGWAVALVRRHRNGPSGRLYSLAVAASARGRGIGPRLVREVLDALAGQGVGRCSLEVREENIRARRLYERFGFEYVKPLPDYYGPGFHGWRMMRDRSAPLPIAVDRGEKFFLVAPHVPGFQGEAGEGQGLGQEGAS